MIMNRLFSNARRLHSTRPLSSLSPASGEVGGVGRPSINAAAGFAALGLGVAVLLGGEHSSAAAAKCEKVDLSHYPIGTRGQPWGDVEKRQWLESRKKSDDRCYESTVLSSLGDMHKSCYEGFRPVNYGYLIKRVPDEDGNSKSTKDFQLLAFVPNTFRSWVYAHDMNCSCSKAELEEARSKPTILITGGTHGYETSGIKGALRFLSSGKAEHYAKYFNIVVVPCLSPWSYEMNERWVSTADDPNRSFGPCTESDPLPLRTEESQKLLTFLETLRVRSTDTAASDNCHVKWLCHIDLHETTDSDVQEFRPAKAAQLGLTEYDNHIPDGFYLVGDSCDIHGKEVKDNNLDFYNAILNAVEGVTHIAETEADGTLCGYPSTSRGLILIPCKKYGICAGGALPDAPFVATTEVYPDSERTNEEECINAQVVAICAALDFLLKKGVALIPLEK